ncbi:LicD family protein [Qipengyuania sp. CAU 1752]
MSTEKLQGAAAPGHDLKALHRVLTMIAADIDTICAEHGITYYLMGGTALGAMRHSGFIPWDDDFDIFMDRENYEKFLATCEDKLDRDKYYLQREATQEWPLYFSKVRLNDTLYVEKEDEVGKMHSGIYIDVMCLHYAYTNKAMRYLQFLAARALSTMALSKRGYHTESKAKRALLAIGRMIAFAPIKSMLLRFVRSLDRRKSSLVGHYFGRAPFAKTTFPVEYLGSPRRVAFEDEMLPVPANVEGYLGTRFGPSYMDMPDQKTRDSFPSHMLAVDFGPYA